MALLSEARNCFNYSDSFGTWVSDNKLADRTMLFRLPTHTYPGYQQDPRHLARQEIAKIEAEISAFDREPVSAETLLKAVRHIAHRFTLGIDERRLPDGAVQLKYRHTTTTVRVTPGENRYHGSYFDVMDGIYDYKDMITSALAWMICQHPNKFNR
jgi:hypothetical protein